MLLGEMEMKQTAPAPREFRASVGDERGMERHALKHSSWPSSIAGPEDPSTLAAPSNPADVSERAARMPRLPYGTGTQGKNGRLHHN